MQSLKEKASNVAASAKSGMEKTKATVQEKVDKMKAHETTEKEMATEKKQERIYEAEMNKQVTQDRNAALRHGADSGTGRPHYSNIGTGEPMGDVTDGIGTVTHNTHVGGGVNPGYGTGAGRQHYSNTGTGEPMGQDETTEKEMATEKKQERIYEAEMNKQVTQDRNAALRHGADSGTGRPHYSNIGTGEPMGDVTDGIGTVTHNTHVGGGVNPGYGTGAGRQHYSNTGTGEPMGQVTDGIAPSYGTGTGRPYYSNTETGEPMGQVTDGIGTGTHNTHVGGGVNPGYGTGGNYS